MIAELFGLAAAIGTWWWAFRPPDVAEARLRAWLARELPAVPSEGPPEIGEVLDGSPLMPGAYRYVVRDGVRYQVFVDGHQRIVVVRGVEEVVRLL